MLKVCEVVSESLPELVVQLLLVLQESGSRPPVLIVSMASTLCVPKSNSSNIRIFNETADTLLTSGSVVATHQDGWQ